MNIRIYSKNIKLSSDLKDYIEYQLKKACKIIEPIGFCVHISRNTHHRKGNIISMEAEVHVPKKMIKASVKGAGDVRSATDLLKNKLRPQITKYKERNSKHDYNSRRY